MKYILSSRGGGIRGIRRGISGQSTELKEWRTAKQAHGYSRRVEQSALVLLGHFVGSQAKGRT
jgi:hypothetical protein